MWKTVALRMTQAKSEIEKMGEDTDGMLESTAKYRDLIKASTGFDILEKDNKTLKSTYEIVLNIGKAWGSLSDIDRNSLLYSLAGTRQSNALAAALNNIDDMQKAYEAAENATGSAQEEQEKYTKSIQYSIDVFKAAKEEFANNLYDSKGLKNTIDGFTKMLEIINSLTKAVGGLGTAFVGLMAYKGFKGQNIFNILGASASGVNSIKNFFTQPVLTDTAVKLGITNSDIKILQDYNHSLQNGTNATLAFRQTMKGASPETRTFAKEMARGNASINQLTTSSKAAALGMNLLNTAMNVGIALVISFAITQISKLANAYKDLSQKADEAIQKVNERKEENSQIDELIEKYKKLKEAETSANKVETRKQTLELQKEISNIIAKQPDIYSAQARQIDLVNGKLEQQLQILNEIERKNQRSVIRDAEQAYRTASDAAKKYKYDVDGFQIGGKNVIWLQGETENPINDAKGRAIIDDLLKRQKFIGESNWVMDGSGNESYNIAFSDRSTWARRLKFLDEAIEKLEQSPEFDTSQKGLYDQLLAAREDINKVVGKQIQSATDYAQILTEYEVQGSMANIESYKDFEKARKEVIDNILNDGTISMALKDQSLSSKDVEKYVDEYISSLNGLSDYYEEWVRNNTETFEAMPDVLKADATFDYADYKDQINEVTKTLDTLSSAYSKFSAGKAPASELMSLYDTFPELAQYGDDASLLTEKIQELADTTVAPLVNSLSALGKTVKDPKQKAMIEGLVQSLKKMADLSAGIEKTADAVDKISDYVKYEEDNVQKIIDKLEEQKDEQNDILDNLKAQKDELENIISEYEKVADTVDKYIDKTQIKPLEQQKSDIEEYYNTQIEKLKEENEERDRNIELQEKQDALANARKTKIKVYTETQGWTVQSDVKAIQNAEKELNDLQNEITIDNLEKQRDSEISDIEKQIKTWEDYKDAWKAQVEQITEADEELVASKILGADWHEKIADQDIDVMNNYGAEYVSYNNRLKNQVNVEISNMEKAIKAREKEITEWKDYKEQITDINKTITESNDTYLQNLNQFVIDENSTWEERIKHMERNAEIIAMLNGKANEIPETDAESMLAGSKMWSITKDDSILGLYSSKEEAEADKKNVIQNLVKKQIAPGMPSSVIEIITKRIMESLHIKQYARGGISTKTGLSWLDGTSSGAEVIFNAAQAKQLYDIVANGNFGRMVSENILDGMKALVTSFGNKQSQPTPSSINISFPNATINAKDYDSFKNFMDTYTTDLLLKMQVGL